MEKILSKLTRIQVLFFTIFIAFVLGGIDWLSGIDLSFFVFYFLPVSGAAWFVGAHGSVFLAILSALIWFGADSLTGHTFAHNIYAVWNTVIRLIAFLTIGWSVAKLRQTIDLEKEEARQLRQSLVEIKVLKSFLRICARCKKIRDEQDTWQQLEVYIAKNANTQFSHGYCPECYHQALAEAGLLESSD